MKKDRMSKVITLTISEPETRVHLNSSLDGAREVKVLDFLRVQSKFVRLVEPQKVYNLNGNEEIEGVLSLGHGYYNIEDLQRSFRRVNKGVDVMNVDGDWFISSRIKVKLTEELYTELGVPEVLTAGKPYPLIWKNTPSFLVYCDIVDSHYSYDYAFSASYTPSHLLSVVPSQTYPSLRVKHIHYSSLDHFNLYITNIDWNRPTFGMNSFVITLRLS